MLTVCERFQLENIAENGQNRKLAFTYKVASVDCSRNRLKLVKVSYEQTVNLQDRGTQDAFKQTTCKTEFFIETTGHANSIYQNIKGD